MKVRAFLAPCARSERASSSWLAGECFADAERRHGTSKGAGTPGIDRYRIADKRRRDDGHGSRDRVEPVNRTPAVPSGSVESPSSPVPFESVFSTIPATLPATYVHGSEPQKAVARL